MSDLTNLARGHEPGASSLRHALVTPVDSSPPCHMDTLTGETSPERTSPMLLTDALASWLLYLKDHDGKTRATRNDYRNHAGAFARWLGAHAVVKDFTLFTTRAHMSEYARRCRPRSVRARLQSLRSFGNWLVSEGHLRENPANALSPPQMDDPERRFPDDTKIALVLAAVSRIADARRQAITRAILTTATHTGLRSTELLDLLVSDVDLSQGVIRVRCGKGGKPRSLYPNEECLEAIREWMRIRERDCAHDYLFALDRGRRVSRDSLRAIMRNAIAIAGFDPHDRELTPHCFRRAYATRLLKNGANLDEIRQALGHSSIYTTGMYLHTSEEAMRRLAELSSLKSKEPTVPPAAPPAPPVAKRPLWNEGARRRHLKRTPLR